MDLIRAIKATLHKSDPNIKLNELTTTWGEQIRDARDASTVDCVRLEHPRPQFARKDVRILNGLWDYAVEPMPETLARGAERTYGAFSKAIGDMMANGHAAPFDDANVRSACGQIRVPFSPEALLSGVGRRTTPNELLWYRRDIMIEELPPLPKGGRMLLHFDGVDYACAIWCDDALVGCHEGAYLPFEVDITSEVLNAADSQSEAVTVILCVWDPSDEGTQLRGKQRSERGGMWYTPQSGIWKPVWAESVPYKHIIDLVLDADADSGMLRISARVSVGGEELAVRVDGDMLASATIREGDGERAELELDFSSKGLHLWSCNDPHLYHLILSYGDDRVESYCAFRTVGIEPDEEGVPRFCLNHKPLFLRGVLDQGYWPDGLMTSPADEAMVYDIVAMKEAGFNMLRKHIKVEDERWYYHCDRLGMLVWQDMPSGGGAYSPWFTGRWPTLLRYNWQGPRDDRRSFQRRLSANDAAYREEWLLTCKSTVKSLLNHPSIVTWVLFNEGWGQFDAPKAVETVRAIDQTRPIDATSGWYDQGCGDYVSIHNYFRPLEVYPDPLVHPMAGPAFIHRDRERGQGGSTGPELRDRAFVMSEFGGMSCQVEGHTSLETSYGYAEPISFRDFPERLRELLSHADALEAEGGSGFVYTQLCDVEEETNGLLAYDRRVNKLDHGRKE